MTPRNPSVRSVRFLDAAGVIRQGDWTTFGIQSGDRCIDPESVSILPPCEPTKIVCAARNYADAVDEPPEEPDLFIKPSTAIVGHGHRVTPPSACGEVLFEGELAVIIGEECRSVPESDAEEVIAGFACANDITNDDGTGTFYRKAFDGSCPIGPAVAPPDTITDDATIEVRINDQTRQRSSLDNLIYDIDQLIATASDYATLRPGDILLTGTPPGRDILEDGDRVAVSVEGVGTLKHTVDRN